MHDAIRGADLLTADKPVTAVTHGWEPSKQWSQAEMAQKAI